MKFNNYKKASKKLIFTMLLFFTAYSSQATIYHVDSSSTVSLPTGASWSTAFNDLNTAIAAASQNDTIWVAQGTYYPGTTRTSEFEVANDNIYGGFAGNETMLSQRNIVSNPTILSGDINKNDNNNIDYTESTRSDNAYTVVSINQQGSNCTLDGFIIEGGNANSSTPGRQRYGGGLYVLKNTSVSSSGDVNISNCIFRKNTAVFIAAVYVYNLSAVSATPLKVILNKCVFRNNQATGSIIGNRAYSAPTETYIFNSLITDNTTNSASLIGSSGRNGGSQKFFVGMAHTTIVDNHKTGTTPVQGMISFYNENSSGNAGSIALANNIIMDDTVKNTISLSPGQTGTLNDLYLGNNLYQDSINSYTATNVEIDTINQFYVSRGDMVQFKDAVNGNFELPKCSFGVGEGEPLNSAGAPSFAIAQKLATTFFNTSSSKDLNNNSRHINQSDFGCYEDQWPFAGPNLTLTFNGTDLNASSGMTNYTWKRNNTTISGASAATYTPTQNGNYEVTAEDQWGCEYTATYSLMNLAVQDFGTAKLKMYPNPVLDMLHIEGDVSEINIYDLSGKLLINTADKEINVASLALGIYILKAAKDGLYYQSKFVKE